MTIQYQQLSFQCTQQQAELLSDLLTDNGALSVSFLEDENEPIFEPAINTTPLWSRLTLVALFDETAEMQSVINLVKVMLGDIDYQVETIAERDWVSETQANFQPQNYHDKLWVYPDWYEIPAEHKAVIKISPGLAFGTGNHPTTQMCLSQLCEAVKPGNIVIDFGCGSGILALAALALGASKVYAIDIDPQALQATQQNAELNGFDAEKIITLLPEHFAADIKADVVVANILAQPLIDLKDVFLSRLKPQGKIILSGLLITQEDMVLKAYEATHPLHVLEQMDEWSCVGA